MDDTQAEPVLPEIWICPRCGARLVSRNLWHSCGQFWASRHECGSIQGSAGSVRSCGRTCLMGPSVIMMSARAALGEWKP